MPRTLIKMSTRELGYCSPKEIKIQRAGKGKMIMKKKVTRGEVSEAQVGGLSLEEKQCAQKLLSIWQNKSHMLPELWRHKEPTHCSMSILRASSQPLHITCAEKFHQLFFLLPSGGAYYPSTLVYLSPGDHAYMFSSI
uniref:Uncharacterized protein n=1 Tax=Rousettus aegyptiacus TaxID=9407 RepID=A0A7J8KAY4_ROUAE|nr:hypothetical protein HJG63_007863 [Rousettus aegyptiacus]